MKALTLIPRTNEDVTGGNGYDPTSMVWILCSLDGETRRSVLLEQQTERLFFDSSQPLN